MVGLHLPRSFVYWLMTRVDPISEVFSSPNGIDFPMTKTQVRWIFGLLKGNKVIPTTESAAEEEMKSLGECLLATYGHVWEGDHPNNTGSIVTTNGIPVNPRFLKRLEGYWEENEEKEFKTMFLIATLQMFLCPTQCGRLSKGLLYACTWYASPGV